MLSSIFHFGQISKFKKGVTPRKKNGIKISCGYAHLHIMSFISTKFHEILLSGFRGVALTRKTGLTDWLTDWLIDGRVKNIIPSATRCVGYKYNINFWLHLLIIIFDIEFSWQTIFVDNPHGLAVHIYLFSIFFWKVQKQMLKFMHWSKLFL